MDSPNSPLDRRRLLAAAAALVVPLWPIPPWAARLNRTATCAHSGDQALAALEHTHGGRLGVFAVDTASGRHLAYRADERFLMCSTFKTLAVALVLARVDSGHEQLGRRIVYTQADLLDYAPVTRAHVQEGALSVEVLCQAAIEVSDNTAANLLLATIGGPPGVTKFVRSLGDTVTRLDRNEPTVNRPDGVLDTSTAHAMVHCVRTILLGSVLSSESRGRLEGWLVASTPGLARLRAGFPAAWRVGDKAGTGDAQSNDVAIVRVPERPPLLVAAFYEAAQNDGRARETVLKEVGAIVAAWSTNSLSSVPGHANSSSVAAAPARGMLG